MWAAILSIIESILAIFSRKSEADTERDAGITSGVAQQKAADESVEVTRANQTAETEAKVGQAAVDGPSDLDESITQAKGGLI